MIGYALAPVLEEIRQADGLILGTPNHLGDVSAGFRALYERIVFQSLSYKLEPRSYNQRQIPVLMIMTSNCEPSSPTPKSGFAPSPEQNSERSCRGSSFYACTSCPIACRIQKGRPCGRP